MNLSQICIKRPVLATVLSLLLIIIGLLAFQHLSVNYLPVYTTDSINVETVDEGASSEYIEKNITTPLEDSISAVTGIDYMTSQSIKGASAITINITTNADYDEVMNDVRTRVNMALKKLPDDLLNSPEVKEGYKSMSLMRLAITDPNMPLQNLQDFVTRNIQDQLTQIEGVGDARAKGAEPYSMLITINPKKLQKLNLSIQEISAAIQDANTQTAAGTISNNTIDFPLNLDTSLKSKDDFADVVVKNQDGTLIRVKDIASVELTGFATSSMISKYNGKPAIIMEVNTTNDANEIATATAIKKFLQEIKPSLPPGLEITPFTDMSVFMKASVNEVYYAIVFAIICVVIVIMFFLGSLRTVFIPVVTIPICLIATFALMYGLDFSINMITLIAIVLAVGLVVDDAIVVLENIYRRIEHGETPYDAAIAGSKEIVFSIVVMTLTLAAVYAPFGFMSGSAAAFLKPFAFTLAGAVLISGFVSLTLSPMMCSKLLRLPSNNKEKGFSKLSSTWLDLINRALQSLANAYQHVLARILKHRTIIILLTLAIAVGGFFLAQSIPFEATPPEDVGMVFSMYRAPQNEDVVAVDKVLDKIKELTTGIPSLAATVSMAQGNNVHGAPSFVILQLKPWDDRTQSSDDVQQILNQKLKQSTGINAVAHSISGSHAGYDGIQFFLYGSADYDQLYKNATAIMDELEKDNPNLYDFRSDIAYDTQEYNISINRTMAAKMNVSISDITDTIATLLGTQQVTSFTLSSFTYYAYLLAPTAMRSDLTSIGNFTVKSSTGNIIPLSELITLTPVISQSSLPHYNRQHATTISAELADGYSMAEAIQYLNTTLPSILPSGVNFTYTGDALEAVDSSSDTGLLFVLAIAFIYLILAAQFESFIDPFVILFSVPLCIVSALLALKLSGGTINLYTTIGLITLIGLIAKHGILITQFANSRLLTGASITESVIAGATIRLRPILMTTAAMTVGALPLLLTSGAGANSRHQIGLVIISGMLGGTFFSLIVVPVAYSLLKQLKQRLTHRHR